MAQTVIFPKLGQTMEEGAIVKWRKQEGDAVAKGDILFEIETDKANLEVESFFEGTLLKILVGEGVTVPVNTVVGFVGTPGEKLPAVVPPPPAPKKGEAGASKAAAAVGLPAVALAKAGDRGPRPAVAATAEAPAPSTLHRPPAAAPAKQIVSPRARALIKESAISAAPIQGTGPSGRVTEKDVRDYLAARKYDAIRISPAAKRLAQAKGVDILSVRGSGASGRIMNEDVERAAQRLPKPMSRMRQVIARRLTESKQTIPHFYVTVTADVTALLKHRTTLKARGQNYSVNDFVLFAVVRALEQFPAVNSSTDGVSVSWRGDVDLGMAVNVENGLVVPVIRAAQQLSLAELRDRAKALTEKARSGKLTPDEMTGSGFTVSNMGMLGVDSFAAIINPGEAGILAVGSAKEAAVVVDGKLAVRTCMALTLSADHRIVDGALGAQFVNAIKARLESVAGWQ
jgi:pyruvate dehydrogenase E2 component (dihydrolipoamide acetyltransferase)